ncbi:MAG: hypothetical protein K2G85_03810 [Muribaculaceae bacterium]|nr:hypothetical protein [Muribaculaceae bacterium]
MKATKIRHTIESEHLARLRKEVEDRLSFPLNGPDDFSRLSDLLKEEGCGTVSATTLKRIWGYISDIGANYRPNAYTVTALCNLVGFKNIEEFCASESYIQSRGYTGKYVESQTLPLGTEIELRWQPNRFCVLRHEKPSLFKVIRVENSTTLREGDIVECGCFTQHAPVYFPRVFRDGANPTTAMAGSASGITFKIITTETPETSNLTSET